MLRQRRMVIRISISLLLLQIDHTIGDAHTLLLDVQIRRIHILLGRFKIIGFELVDSEGILDIVEDRGGDSSDVSNFGEEMFN